MQRLHAKSCNSQLLQLLHTPFRVRSTFVLVVNYLFVNLLFIVDFVFQPASVAKHFVALSTNGVLFVLFPLFSCVILYSVNVSDRCAFFILYVSVDLI